MSNGVDISICVCTYKRPELLGVLLSGIQNQIEGDLQLEIVVADNDPNRSSRPVLEAWIQRSRFPLICLHVPIPNIALARNACLDSANGNWIAFIDDDELPSPSWVTALMQACRIYDADIVFGPVLPVLPTPTPAWISEGRFFERPRHATGTMATLRDARTSNALVSRELLASTPMLFDPDFGRTGGEDAVFFDNLERNGARMIWSDDAIVHETVPLERARLSWLLQRSFRTGQVAVRIQLLRIGAGTRLGKRIVLAVHSAGNFTVWSVIALFRAPFSIARSIRAALDAASYLGRFLGAFGHRYQEYRH